LKLEYIFRSVATFASMPVWPLFKKKDGPIVVYVPHKESNVDIKYLLAYKCSIDKKHVNVVIDCEGFSSLKNILTRKGFRVICLDTWEELNVVKNASVIISSVNTLGAQGLYWLALGAKYIQVWHGITIKNIGFHFEKYYSPYNQLIRWGHSFITHSHRFGYLLVPDSFYSKLFDKYFWTHRKVYGWPVRNDYWFFKDSFDRELMELGANWHLLNWIKRLKKEQKTKVILYIPTWRKSFSWAKFFSEIDMVNKLERLAVDKNAVVIMKFHPMEELGTRLTSHNLEYLEGIERLSEHIYIYRDIPGTFSDPMPLLDIGDVLITDYSSVYFDYLLGKPKNPIVFWWFDKDQYHLEERILPYVTPGYKVKMFDELLSALNSILDGNDPLYNERKKVRKLVYGSGQKQPSSSIIWSLACQKTV